MVDEYLDTELEQVDGVYDFVPSGHSQLDTLYDMLSSFNEDSVNIYAGLNEPPSPNTAGDEPSHRADGRDTTTPSDDDAPVEVASAPREREPHPRAPADADPRP